MKIKKIFLVLFAVALLVSVFSLQAFAATQYTITIKSNDGSETFWTQTVDSGSKFEIMTYGARIGANEYTYSGSRQFLGFATSANSTSVSSFYAVGYTGEVKSNLTLYVVDSERIGAHTVVGDPITGADTYELWMNNVDVKQMHPELDNYILFSYTKKNVSNYKTFYAVIVSSHVNVSSMIDENNTGDIWVYFPEGNRGYYKTDFETKDEALVWLLDSSHTIESFTELRVRPYNYSGVAQSCSVIYSTASYIMNPHDNSILTVGKFYQEPWTKFAESSDLCFDLDTLNLSAGSHTFKVKAKGAGYYDSDFSNEVTYNQVQKYSVTTTFTNLTAYNCYDMAGSFDYAYQNKPLSLCLTPTYGYLQPDDVVVTMGGNTLAAGTGYYYDSAGFLIIPRVTGDVTITAQGLLKVAAPVIEKEGTGEFDFLYPLGLTFNEVKNASGYAAYVDGVEVTAADLKITVTDGVVSMLIPKTAFSANGTYQVYVVALPVEGYMASNPSNIVTVDVTLHMLPAEIVEAPEYITDEYLYAFKVAFCDPQATGFGVFIDGVLYNDVNVGILDDGEYYGYVQIPAAAFVGGDGTFEIYLETYGPEGSVSSGPSNILTCTVAKLATPEIRLE